MCRHYSQLSALMSLAHSNTRADLFRCNAHHRKCWLCLMLCMPALVFAVIFVQCTRHESPSLHAVQVIFMADMVSEEDVPYNARGVVDQLVCSLAGRCLWLPGSCTSDTYSGGQLY